MMVLHADSNSFYANCERLFRPDLHNKPVIVLSNNDGIIIALTQEAKDLGLKRGDPYFKVKSFCIAHGVEMFSSNYTLYADISRRITSIYLEYAPEIEQYSIDESFLFFPEFSVKEITEISAILRKRVLKETGMPICVGAGPTKTIAKWYNKHAKQHNGVYIYNSNFDSELEKTPVQEIWGIGPRKAEKLINLGISNGLQLKNMDIVLAKKALSITGVYTIQELNGIQILNKIHKDSKDIITSSRQFGKRIYDLPTLKMALTQYTQNAVEKMRKQNCEAGMVSVYLSTCYSFDENENATIPYANGAVCKLDSRTSYTPEILCAAVKCLNKIYREGFGYKTIMVNLMDLEGKCFQRELFKNNEFDNKKRDLMKRLDQINAKYGRGTLVLSSSLGKDDWQMKRDALSPCYTTRLSDIPQVW